MNIKFALKEDIPRLYGLCMKWAEAMGYDVEEQELKDDLERMFLSGCIILAEDDDKIVGMMTGLPVYHFWIKQKFAHEHWFFVHPDYRSRGVAKLMEKAFEYWAKNHDCTSLILTPNKFGSMNPEEAMKRFQKYGYEIHGYTMRRKL